MNTNRFASLIPTSGFVDYEEQPITAESISTRRLLKIYENQAFPADLVLLLSSDDSGQCYVDTANLDGETNVKLRECPAIDLESERDLMTTDITVTYSPPNANLSLFRGKVTTPRTS